MEVLDVYTQGRMMDLSKFFDFVYNNCETFDDVVRVSKCVDYLAKNESDKARKVCTKTTNLLLKWSESQN